MGSSLVDEQLQQGRDKVFSHYCSDETDVTEIPVSFDGTWSKRGYTQQILVLVSWYRLKLVKYLISILSQRYAKHANQQRRILVKILPSVTCGTSDIKTNAPKLTLDQVGQWSAPQLRRFGTDLRKVIYIINL